ncbi:MAG: hypothetical protein FWC69_01240 [Defluviitaleaceae bacterium]|nr:hypothetical protein [Defluviitaleaceae bacterium]
MKKILAGTLATLTALGTIQLANHIDDCKLADATTTYVSEEEAERISVDALRTASSLADLLISVV